jgi:hypothetical protein
MEALIRIPGDLIQPELVEVIGDIIYNVVPQLRDDMLVKFMWSLELWSATSLKVQEKLYGILNHLYNSTLKLTKDVTVLNVVDSLI